MNHTKFKVKVEVIDYWLLVYVRTFNAKIEKFN